MPSFIIPSFGELIIYASHDIFLVIDGQQTHEIPKNEKLIITRYEYDAVFLRFTKNNLRQLTKLGY